MRDATGYALITAALAAVFGGVVLLTRCESAEDVVERVERREAAEEADRQRAARQREYEERTKECEDSARIEMLTEAGDVHLVCPTSVRDAQGQGWVVRYPDAGER